jgi:hypothetical protein
LDNPRTGSEWKKEGIHLSKGERAAEAFQSLFSHIDGKIRGGYGVDGRGRKVVVPAEVDTDPAFALSVIWDIPRCDGVRKPLKKKPTPGQAPPGLEPGTSRM